MDSIRDNQRLHKFGLQVQQLLGTELFGFDNINNLKWEMKRTFGYSADDKAEEFGYPSFKDMLDAKVLDNYVEIEKLRVGEGGQMVQTRYKAKQDKNTCAVHREQMIYQREKERKEERKHRQMARQFDALMYPPEKFGQTSAAGKGHYEPTQQQQRQNHRFYHHPQRDHSPAMEMNGALDSSWYTNNEEDNNRNNDDDGREEVSDSDGASAKLAADYTNFFGAHKGPNNLHHNNTQAKPSAQKHQQQQKSPPKKVVGVPEWSSSSADEQQHPNEEEEEEQRTQAQRPTTGPKFVGISSWAKAEHTGEQQRPHQQSKQHQQLLPERHVHVTQKSAKLISLSSDEEEEDDGTHRKPPPPSKARHAHKKPLSVADLKHIIWSEDEDNTDKNLEHVDNHGHSTSAPAPPPAPLPSNAGAVTSANAASTSSCASNSNIGGTSKFPPVDSNPSRWSAETLCQWLTAAGLVDCAQRLLDEEVDGACLLVFTPFHYQKLGLKLGPMIKLQQMVEHLQQFTTSADGR